MKGNKREMEGDEWKIEMERGIEGKMDEGHRGESIGK